MTNAHLKPHEAARIAALSDDAYLTTPTPATPDELRHFEAPGRIDTVLDAVNSAEIVHRGVILTDDILTENAIPGRCSCSFEHQPHDRCDGNPGAGMFRNWPQVKPETGYVKGAEPMPSADEFSPDQDLSHNSNGRA